MPMLAGRPGLFSPTTELAANSSAAITGLRAQVWICDRVPKVLNLAMFVGHKYVYFCYTKLKLF
jgi:hypothetical protein